MPAGNGCRRPGTQAVWLDAILPVSEETVALYQPIVLPFRSFSSDCFWSAPAPISQNRAMAPRRALALGQSPWAAVNDRCEPGRGRHADGQGRGCDIA
jgi:hypothetical protein